MSLHIHIHDSAEHWSITFENELKRVSSATIAGVNYTRIEVKSYGKSGKTLLGSNALGAWKVRGYKANGQFAPTLAELKRKLV